MNDKYIYHNSYYYRNKEYIKIRQKKWVDKNRKYVNNYMREYMRVWRLNKALKQKNSISRGIIKLEPRKPYFLKFINKNTTIYFD